MHEEVERVLQGGVVRSIKPFRKACMKGCRDGVEVSEGFLILYFSYMHC